MWRLTERMVRSTFVTAWRFATSPTSTSPFLANATTLGVVRLPSALAMTVGSPPSSTETTEFVVPGSIPTARAMSVDPSRELWCCGSRKALVLGGRLGLSLLDSVSHASGIGQVVLSLTRSTYLLSWVFPSAAYFYSPARRTLRGTINAELGPNSKINRAEIDREAPVRVLGDLSPCG